MQLNVSEGGFDFKMMCYVIPSPPIHPLMTLAAQSGNPVLTSSPTQT